MQEKLIIYLHEQDLSRPSWAVVDADGQVRQATHHDNADGLASIAEDKEVIVVVPAQDVLLTRATLPKMSRSRLAQALPYALEEQLIADVDSLHFAAGDLQADGSLPVAVIAHEKMQLWLATLQAWGLQPDSLLPMMLALPLEENNLHVVISELVVMRTGECQGFACDVGNFNALLDMALAAMPKQPTLIYIHNASHQALPPLSDLVVECREEKIEMGELIADLSSQAAKACPINLLQGRYASKKSRFPQMKKMWKWAACLGAAWVVLLFLYPAISYFILAKRVNGIEDQMAVIYKRNFPQANSMVAPKLRMEEKWRKVSAQIGENRLLLLIANVGKGMQATPNIKLNRLDFQNNQLTLELSAASSDQFTAFADYLTQQGLSVKQQNVNLIGERVNATLQIE